MQNINPKIYFLSKKQQISSQNKRICYEIVQICLYKVTVIQLFSACNVIDMSLLSQRNPRQVRVLCQIHPFSFLCPLSSSLTQSSHLREVLERVSSLHIIQLKKITHYCIVLEKY